MSNIFSQEIFTSNAVCSAKNCVNPIFPGLEDLYTLSKEQFSCQTLQDVAKSLDFCKGVVNYNPSLPKPASEKTVAELVREQEQRAMTSYFVHLNAMGLEAWDYSHPANSGDICAESVWRLACYTYFPKTPVGGQFWEGVWWSVRSFMMYVVSWCMRREIVCK